MKVVTVQIMRQLLLNFVHMIQHVHFNTRVEERMVMLFFSWALVMDQGRRLILFVQCIIVQLSLLELQEISKRHVQLYRVNIYMRWEIQQVCEFVLLSLTLLVNLFVIVSCTMKYVYIVIKV